MAFTEKNWENHRNLVTGAVRYPLDLAWGIPIGLASCFSVVPLALCAGCCCLPPYLKLDEEGHFVVLKLPNLGVLIFTFIPGLIVATIFATFLLSDFLVSSLIYLLAKIIGTILGTFSFLLTLGFLEIDYKGNHRMIDNIIDKGRGFIETTEKEALVLKKHGLFSTAGIATMTLVFADKSLNGALTEKREMRAKYLLNHIEQNGDFVPDLGEIKHEETQNEKRITHANTALEKYNGMNIPLIQQDNVEILKEEIEALEKYNSAVTACLPDNIVSIQQEGTGGGADEYFDRSDIEKATLLKLRGALAETAEHRGEDQLYIDSVEFFTNSTN